MKLRPITQTAIYQGGIVIPTGGTIDISDQAVAPLGVFYGVEYVDSGHKKDNI